MRPLLRIPFRLLSVALLFSLGNLAACAQFAGAPPTTTVHDPAALKPPLGARVAIVEWEDLECPDCANANPLLKQAAAQYHIPWVRHDFPLPFHAWSFDAAVDARWFDTKSQKLGDEFRDAVFADQQNIRTPEDLHAFAEKFATEHSIAFPFVVDPQKKLAGLVQADYALGQRVGIEHTPTIWVVTNKKSGVPFVEIVQRDRLYRIIDDALASTKDEGTPAVHRASGTHPGR